MQHLYGYLATLIVAIVSALGLYLKGRKDGTRKSDAEKLRNEAVVSERRATVATSAKHVADDVSSLPSGDAASRLQDKYRRD